MPDLSETGRFLGLLSGGDPVTFQTFDDSPAKRKPLSKILHGSLQQHGDTLASLNGRGAGVFVMVNAGDLKGRSTRNVHRVRAVFVDLDGSPLEPVQAGPLQRQITVESSPGRYHAYWLVDGFPLAEFSPVQQMLAQRFDSDPTVKDLPRVMRLPGFLHQKAQPHLTHILSASSGRYSRDKFLSAFNFDPATSNWQDKSVIPEGQRNDKLFSMARGFVTKGFAFDQIQERLSGINEKQCQPPLPKAELRDLVHQALKYPTIGVLSLDYRRLVDSPNFRSLSPTALKLYTAICRMTNGSTEIVISLRPSDLAQWGFANRSTLAKYRNELIAAGFLICHRPPSYRQQGEIRECGLYGLASPSFMPNRDIKTGAVYHTTCLPNVVNSRRREEVETGNPHASEKHPLLTSAEN